MNEIPPEQPAAAGALLLILGPTASGKSALAARVAAELGGVVINCDSMQVYRDLHILTARPEPDLGSMAPHRLYGFQDAAEACSAALWSARAAAEIAACHAAGQVPVLCGGTGLYVRALLQGLAPVPEVAPEFRQAAMDLLRREGGEGMRQRLLPVDPAAAARLNAGDSQRLIRAWEVWLATGRSLTDWQQIPGEPPVRARTFVVVLDPPRSDLYARCDARFDMMLAEGALEEVARLRARDLDPELPAMKALGVPALIAHLDGNLSLEAAQTQAQTATRRYAKRQGTWFRHQIVADFRQNTKQTESVFAEIFPKISEFLLTVG
ncbi:MAG: tRNA (adenosine(37)-N6)-dimethylallyltransferase MiaA [Minwuia sp.]|nr:tRNA (adenosine(37)-N6)-dimethylallyltransferase MiaA [Minwuia sp.]